MLKLLLNFEIQKIKRYFKTKASAKLITIVLFSLVLLFVASGIYGFFVSALRYIDFSIDADLRLPLNLFLYEVFLLVISLLIILGTLISGIFLLFKGKNDTWFLSSPSSKLFPHIILGKSVFSSLWPLLVLFLPLLLAFNRIYELSFSNFIIALFGITLLQVGLSVFTLSGVLCIGYSYFILSRKGYVPRFNFGRFVAVLALLSAGTLLLFWRIVKNVDIVKIFRAEDTERVIGIADIGSHFSFLPSHKLAELLISFQEKALVVTLFSIFSLLLFTALSLIFWYFVTHYFNPLWQRIQEGDRALSDTSSHSSQKKFTYLFTGNQTAILFKKELLVFTRNKKGVLWLLFLLALWCGQIGAHHIIAKNIARHTPDITAQYSLLQSMEFVIALYFMAAFTLRFVFPSFSSEKKVKWILNVAPLNTKKIFFGKYFFYIVFFSLLGLLMQMTSQTVLGVSFEHSLLPVSLFLFSIFSIVTLGICLGALFPSEESDDPEVISTSLPGLFFTLVSLCFASLVSYLLYLSLLGKIDTSVLELFFVATGVTMILLVSATLRSKQKQIVG